MIRTCRSRRGWRAFGTGISARCSAPKKEKNSVMVNDSTTDLTRPGDSGEFEETPAQIEVEREGFSLSKTLFRPRTLISFALAIAIIVFVFRGFNIDLDKPWAYMPGPNGS